MSLTLTPLIFNLGPTELIIILVIVLLLFGGSRLAGLGKSSGRALKEFKEETRGLRDSDQAKADQTPAVQPPPTVNPMPSQAPPSYQQSPYQQQSGQSSPYQQGPGQPTPPNNLADPSAPNAR